MWRPDWQNQQLWVVPTLFDVRYDPDHGLLGQLMAWASMVPVLLVVAFVAIAVVHPDLYFLAFFAALLGSQGVGWVLKQLFRQARPDGSYLHGYGLPSAHAHFMSFVLAYALLHLWRRAGLAGPTPRLRRLLSAGLIVTALLVWLSRVYMGVHSVEQVGLGMLTGTLLGLLSFFLVERYAPLLFPALEAHPLGRWLRLRDSTAVPNALRAEYEAFLSLKKPHSR
jgi:dolichyldiphosphatase